MQRSTFKVLFLREKAVGKNMVRFPSWGRITINGTMSQFSCKLSVRSSLWDAKANKAAAEASNRSASTRSWRISRPISASSTSVSATGDSYVTAEKVRNAFLGMGDDCRLLLQTFDEYLAGFLDAWAKTALIPVMRTTANAAGVWPPSRIRVPRQGHCVQRVEAGVYRKVRGLPLLGTRDAFRDDPFDHQETEADDLHGV